MLEGNADIGDFFTIDATLIGYDDGNEDLGISESFITYKPLSQQYRHQWRVGAFYPVFSLENVDTAWHSPYTYSFSAINSWLAEELRIIGAEYQLSRPGRAFNSPHSWALVVSVYGANDGLGSLLSWRGWAIHDRQTLLTERIEFANYPSFQGRLASQPSWVEPFKETDNRPGYYIGGHWRYGSNSDLRLYYYDNNGDGRQVESSGQYAWQTQFTSLAWQYRLTQNTRLLTQWLSGETQMGSPVTDIEYDAYYLLLSHRKEQHRFSLRYDWFDTTEQDHYPFDPNDSQGNAWAATWRFQYHPHVEIGAEYLELTSSNENRELWSVSPEQRQKQLQLVMRISF